MDFSQCFFKCYSVFFLHYFLPTHTSTPQWMRTVCNSNNGAIPRAPWKWWVQAPTPTPKYEPLHCHEVIWKRLLKVRNLKPVSLFAFVFALATHVKGPPPKCKAGRIDCHRTGKCTVCRRARASFSPESLHAGAVKGLKTNRTNNTNVILPILIATVMTMIAVIPKARILQTTVSTYRFSRWTDNVFDSRRRKLESYNKL